MQRAIGWVLISFLFAGIAGCASVGSKVDAGSQYFSVRIPTVQEETDYVWRTLGQLKFYKDNGYRPYLPSNTTVEELIGKAEKGQLVEADRTSLLETIKKDVYKEQDYTKALWIVAGKLELADTALPRFEHFKSLWGFFIPRHYEIVLTLYGTGGSYDPEKGIIFLKTTADGRFAKSENPLDTILHEAVHIGIDKVIVKRYGLPQWTKERVVDQFMMHNFQDICPGYTLQRNPETLVDMYLQEPGVWDRLPSAIEEYVTSISGNRM